MNFATWSIRDPIPSILLFFLLTVAGLWGFQGLKVQDLPDIDLPTVSVTLRQPGAAPTQLETEVARLVEDSIATVDGLKHQRTSIGEGQVTITAEFVLERRLADALLDVKDAIDRVRSDLPQDLEEPQVSKVLASSGQAMLTYSVASATRNEEALSWFVDDTVARAVLGTPGIGRFARIGGVQREVQVEVDPARLASLGVTAADVSHALKRVQQDASGGRGDLSGMRQGVRTIATVAEAQQLAALPIALTDGRSIRLDSVATVRDTVAERSQIALLDGQPAVGFQIYRSRGADETRIAATIDTAIARLEAQHPDLKFERITSTVEYVEQQYSGSMLMLYEGALLAVLVVWLFLRDWRATLVGAVALPLSIIPTFAVMSWFGFTLNTVTLLALAVVVGILVDDAIVEIENIARHVRMGKSVRAATEEAVTEIATPVIATTMTLVAVFLPTAFMRGVSGQFFQQFGWSIVAAVLTSLLVARLITPMMAVYLLRPHPEEEKDGKLMQRYLRLVRWCLAHKRTTALAGAVFFVASLLLVPLIPTGLMAAADRSSTMITVEMPPGTNLETTLATAERARKAITGTPGIKSILTTVGESGQSSPLAPSAGGDVRKASLRVTFLERGTRPTQSQIERNLRPLLQTVPGARFTIGADSAGQQMQLILSSQDSAALKVHAQALEHGMRELNIISGVNSTASLERPEIVIRPDAARAAERGVTTQAIGETIRIATTGDFDAALAKLNLDSRQIDIRVRIPEAARTDLQSLAALRVPGRYGPVPLDSIATLTIESGPSQIDRFDRARNVTISADLAGTPLGDAVTAAKKLPAFKSLPPSIQVNNTGATEIMAELFGGFGLAMLTAVLCMFCVLVLLFKDFFQPITILSAIPLSAGGAFIALLIAHNELGVSSMIGLITLMGIVTKNSILLVEYAIVGIRDRGMSEIEALVDACHKRARPIVMTTVAMIAGMIPLALGIGSDASFRQPMAVAVIGGLVSSTALSLLLVPVAFLYVTRLERLIMKRTALEAVIPPPRPAA